MVKEKLKFQVYFVSSAKPEYLDAKIINADSMEEALKTFRSFCSNSGMQNTDYTVIKVMDITNNDLLKKLGLVS